MKRLLIIIFGVLLLLPVQVLAEGRSIQPFNNTSGIGNNGPGVSVVYEEKPATVYYGSDGINIISADGIKHLDTSFEVLKLIAVDDVDGDGYTDFLTYQKAQEYTSQVITVSGSDGHSLSGVKLTHAGYHSALGEIENNSYIQQLLFLGEGQALVVYDYTAVIIDLTTGDITASFSNTDNLWKAVMIDDLNGDGKAEIACSGQNNVLLFLDGETLEQIRMIHPTADLEVSPSWDQNRVGTAVMNTWDLLYEDGILYVTTEDGYLCVLNPADEMAEESMMKIPLEVMAEDAFKQLLTNQMTYYNDHTVYDPTGVMKWQFNGYRIVDSNEKYLLLNCYMGDNNAAYEYTDQSYPPYVLVYDKEEMAVTGRQAVENFASSTMQTCLGVYNEQTVMAVINGTDEGSVRISLYDMSGEIVTQKDISVSIVSPEKKNILSWDGEKYILEILGKGVAYINANLSLKGYAYNSETANLISAKNGYNVVMFSTNGKKDRLVCYDSDMATVRWSWHIPTNFNNKGIENITVDKDYNGDGIPDPFSVVNEYRNDSFVRSVVYVLNGTNGSAYWANSIITSQYQENGKTITNYLYVSDISMVADYDRDGLRELCCGTTVISSKEKKIIGDLGAGIDTSARLVDVGDINRDGVKDYIAVSNKEARVYLSSVSYSYGYVSCEYKKQNTAVGLESKFDPVNTVTEFGDINRDGVKELVVLDYNKEKHQVFKVLNGANLSTMITLCPDGVHDYGETFKVLSYDINGDGYNEVYGRLNWGSCGIFDGKSGEMIIKTTYDTNEEKQMENDVGMNTYYPDYTVPFYPMEETENFVLVDDFSGDGKKDLAISRSSINEDNWRRICYLEMVETAGNTVVDQIIYDASGTSYSSSIIAVGNSDRYIIMIEGENCTLVDMSAQKILATYNLNPVTATQFEDERIMVRTVNDQLFFIDAKPSFDLLSEIPETTSDHILKLKWEPRQDYSVMTVTDNGNEIFIGPEKEFETPLMQGEHTIMLEMNDGQGKTYQETYRITVEPQSAQYYWLIGVVAVTVVLSILLGVYQKISIRKRFRKEAGR